MVITLGQEELPLMIMEQDETEVRCTFCGRCPFIRKELMFLEDEGGWQAQPGSWSGTSSPQTRLL
jgi:hypothetical protein